MRERRWKGSQYGRREDDLPCVGSAIWKRRGDSIRKRKGISLCRKKEVGDPNIEEGRIISLCGEPNMEEEMGSYVRNRGHLSVWEGRGRGSQYGRGRGSQIWKRDGIPIWHRDEIPIWKR